MLANGSSKPCLLTLPVTCLLMAAKLQEEISPSITRMLELMEKKFDIELKKRNVLLLEEHIIRTLDFSLQ